MISSTHTIQGVNIRLRCDQRLHSRISNYFDFYYKGEPRQSIKSVLYELSIVKSPPAIPAEAVRVFHDREVSCYLSGKHIYYASEDGSVMRLDPVSRIVKGDLRENILDNPIILYTLAGAPFADILKYDSLYSLHSSALYHNGTGYLFSGDSGSGKTSAALGLVAHGFKYVSDDVVLLEEVKGEIIAHSLTKTFNIDRLLGSRFPGIVKEENLPSESGAKVTVNIEQVVPGSFVPRLRPDVMIFLKITSNGKSRIDPLNQFEVFRALLKQTLLAADKEVSQNQIQTLGKLVRQVRGFELLRGRDICEDPTCLIKLLAETGCRHADN
ncbi:MAG: hypothetical protein HZC49_03680 [Nitrospirae bacterium]|nr:hypothetical protein [Nitrospirota bacterium]